MSNLIYKARHGLCSGHKVGTVTFKGGNLFGQPDEQICFFICLSEPHNKHFPTGWYASPESAPCVHT